MIEQYKISALVDEFFINRVDKGQKASFEMGQEEYQVSILKIYPGIDKGTFKIDFSIDKTEVMASLRLGQSLQLKFNLSDSESKLQMANGGFMQNTAGNWVFVLSNDGTQARKQLIRTGRKNPQSIEIVSGLKAGDKIITSSYASFFDAEQLNIAINN